MNLRLLEYIDILYRYDGYIKVNGRLRGRSKFDMERVNSITCCLMVHVQIYKLTMYATRTRNP